MMSVGTEYFASILTLVFFAFIRISYQQCPPDCTCKGEDTSCALSKSQLLPVGIGSSTRSLTIEPPAMQENDFGELTSEKLSSFSKLEMFTIVRGGVTGIGPGAFTKFESLKTLNLGYNKIANLYPGSFIAMPALKTLNLTNNSLTSLEDFVFRGLTLNELDLSKNKIVKIADNAFYGAKITSLDISDNQLGVVKSVTFRPLGESLDALDLSKNTIPSLASDFFTSLTKVTTIHLSHNKIRDVSAAMFDSLKGLKWLDLQSNAISGLKEDFLSILNRLNLLNVNNNPFHCNCNLRWMKTFAQPNKTCSHPGKCFTRVDCKTPRDLPLKDFPDDQFVCAKVSIYRTDVRVADVVCRARGDPAPSIWWKAPSGKIIPSRNEMGPSDTNGTLALTLQSEIGSYQCIAGNQLGNVTKVVEDVGTCRQRDVCYGPGSIAGAILGTFTVCVIIVLILFTFRHKIARTTRKDLARKKPQSRFKNSVYRDITVPTRAEDQRPL